MKDAAIYLRVSTIQQDYNRQKNELIELVTRDGYNIKYIFEEKISGRNDERPEFMKLQQLTYNDIQRIYVWEISRLSRRAAKILDVCDEFAEKNISIHSKKENIYTLEDNGSWNATARMVLGLFASMAQNEIITIKDRMQSGILDKMISGELCYTFSAPYGYKKVDGRLVVDEEESKIVQQVFNYYESGLSIKEIHKLLGLSAASITNMLSNTVYIGEKTNKYLPGKVFYNTPIIDKEQFDRVQDIKQKARKNKVTTKYDLSNPLRGKIKCVCGCTMYRYKGQHKGYKYDYYMCREKHITMQTSIIYIIIDRLLESAVNKLNNSSDKKRTRKLVGVQEKIVADADKKIQADISKKELLEKKIKMLQENDIDSSDEIKAHKKLCRDIEQNIKKLQEERNKLKAMQDSLDQVLDKDWEKIKEDIDIYNKVVQDQVEWIKMYKLKNSSYIHIKLLHMPQVYGCNVLLGVKMKNNQEDRIQYIIPDYKDCDEWVLHYDDTNYEMVDKNGQPFNMDINDREFDRTCNYLNEIKRL